jgi:hypothetical protein
VPQAPGSREGQSLRQTVNKQAGQRRQEWRHLPNNLREGKLTTVAVMRKASLESGGGPLLTQKKKKTAIAKGR